MQWATNNEDVVSLLYVLKILVNWKVLDKGSILTVWIVFACICLGFFRDRQNALCAHCPRDSLSY